MSTGVKKKKSRIKRREKKEVRFLNLTRIDALLCLGAGILSMWVVLSTTVSLGFLAYLLGVFTCVLVVLISAFLLVGKEEISVQGSVSLNLPRNELLEIVFLSVGLLLFVLFLLSTDIFAKVFGFSLFVGQSLVSYGILFLSIFVLSLNRYEALKFQIVFKDKVWVLPLSELGRYIFSVSFILFLVSLLLDFFVIKLHKTLPSLPYVLLIIALASGIEEILFRPELNASQSGKGK